MKHLFNLIDIADETKREVKDTDFKKYYPTVNRSQSWAGLEPYIKTAVRTYVYPYLESMWPDLEAYVELDTEDKTIDEMNELLEILNTAIAYYSIYDAMPHLNIDIGESGVMEKSKDNISPAQAWRFKSTRWECMIKADLMMDFALDYLEKNLDVLVFSSYISQGTELFKTTNDIKDYFNISGRRAFLKMQKWIVDAERTIKGIICVELYDEILDKIKAESVLTSFEEELWRRVKHYVADSALVEAIPRISLLLDGDGLKLVSSTDNYNSKVHVITSTGHEQARDVIMKLKLDTESRKRKILDYLHANPGEFETWKALQPDAPTSNMVLHSINKVGGIAI